MAYVAARRRGRFEIRESLHTPAGPRARTLAGFRVLSDDALANAASRATRPFDAAAVVSSARRAGARVTATQAQTGAAEGRPAARRAEESSRFLQASRRMASALRYEAKPSRSAADAGAELIDLLRFADLVSSSQPRRRRERLKFPVMRRLVDARVAATAAG
jgi:hypothetical protein